MAVPGIMVVDSILVDIKVHILSNNIVYFEDSVIINITCDLELALDILQCQNIGDLFINKPYLTTPFHMSFSGES